MNRRDFGSWGSGLSDAKFAQALAALGVLEAVSSVYDIGPDSIARLLDEAAGDGLMKHPVRWRFSGELLRLRGEISRVPADSLTSAWNASKLFGKVRLEVDRTSRLSQTSDAAAMLPWVVSALSRSDVGVRSVYVRTDRPAVDVGWHWPLRVGLLADTASVALERKLRREIESESWMLPLVTLVDASDPRSGTDILLLPGNLRSALLLAGGADRILKADCTVVMGKAEGMASQWHRVAEGLRAMVQTSGVVIASVPASKRLDWFKTFLRQLSHNDPIDVAFYQAGREAGSAPFISAARKLVDAGRLSTQMRKMGGHYKSKRMKNVSVDVTRSSAAERSLGMTPGSYKLHQIGERLERMSEIAEASENPAGFESETATATGTAEIAATAATAAAAAAAAVPPMAESPPRPRSAPDATPDEPTDDSTRAATSNPEPRFIQAKVFDTDNPAAPLPRRQSFRAEINHVIAVRIGLPDKDFISGSPDRPFPVDELPPDQDEYELTVVLAIPQLTDAPQLGHITLPRHGNSDECRFNLVPRAEWERVEARIIILHQNRVIQTSLMSGDITTSEQDSGEGITVETEVVVRANLDNLDNRQHFDAALLLNHSNGGVAGITSISDDHVARFTPSPTMQNAIDAVDQLLTDVAREPKKYMGDLFAKPVVDLLRKFARQGTLLRDHIVRDGDFASKGLDGDGPLQVISAVADARLPVELIYSRASPATNAPLCPKAVESLRAGKCSDCVGAEDESKVICPLAFWGMQRVIERHRHDQRNAPIRRGEAFAARDEPSEGRPSLDLLRAGVVAGSQRVESTVKGGLAEICKLIGGTSAALIPVPTWDDWKTEIGRSAPSLMVLIVHTEPSEDDEDMPRMEIGADSWLPVADISGKYLLKETFSPPLVLLLGCETGVPDKEFANFVNKLRNEGAAIVVAAGAKIHSLHAVPVAKEFVTAIQRIAKRKGATFGEIMRDVRREMLAQGLPMVLTLTAYGDADWELGPVS